jgi:hypothetical protein
VVARVKHLSAPAALAFFPPAQDEAPVRHRANPLQQFVYVRYASSGAGRELKRSFPFPLPRGEAQPVMRSCFQQDRSYVCFEIPLGSSAPF